MNQLWEGITSSDNRVRAGSIAGLRHFLSPEKAEFHDRVASALALAGRLDNDEVVLKTLKPVIESAMKEIPEAMKAVSWQGLKLRGINFAGRDLSGFDFRDSVLEEADFSGATLTAARFDATRLNASKFENAKLMDACLEYADLADASLKGADLSDANLRHVKIQNCDLAGAVLTKTRFSEFMMDWRLARNWRTADLDPVIQERLLAKYGPPRTGPRILMMMWEFFPIVSGGSWTAAYHLLNNWLKIGVDVAVMVPWPSKELSADIFGNEIELIPLDINAPGKGEEAYSPYSWLQKPTSASLYDASISGQPGLLEMIREFTRRAQQVIAERDLSFDVIHAHDWVSFAAAAGIARDRQKPWVAHFHSTAADRQRGRRNTAITRIERMACSKADRIVVPSGWSKQRLIDLYQAPADRVVVVPNCLSDRGVPETRAGEFRTGRVVFLGRMTWQKGPDLFAAIARKLHDLRPRTECVMIGKGDMKSAVERTSTIERVDMPPPEKIAAMTFDKDHPIQARVEFEEIQAVLYHQETDSISTLGKAYSKRKTRLVGRQIAERGFTAYPVRFQSPYTHRIAVTDRSGDFHGDYLVVANGLKRIQTSEERFIEFQDFQEWKHRAEALVDATVLVVPSRFEPFGMVVLEAMQQEVPVAVARTAGVCEVLKSGLRIDPEDAEKSAQQILAILNDEAAWRAEASSGYEEVAGYPARGYELDLLSVFEELAHQSVQRPARTDPVGGDGDGQPPSEGGELPPTPASAEQA